MHDETKKIQYGMAGIDCELLLPPSELNFMIPELRPPKQKCLAFIRRCHNFSR